MAIIPGVTVDYTLSPRIITIPATVDPTAVIIADLQDTLQDLEDDENGGIVYPRLRDCSGGENLGGGSTVAYTMKLTNAQVSFSAEKSPACSGTATSGDATGRILTDTAATFITDGLERGDTVLNYTSRAIAMVTEVISETQLRHVQLAGGSRTTWVIGDEYSAYEVTRCGISGGNLTAVDANGDAIPPVLKSPYTHVERVSATSAGLVNVSLGVVKNVQLPAFEFLMRDSADHITPKTGLTITAQRSIDGAAFAACANAAPEVGSGVYKITLEASDVNGNVITLKFTASGADAAYATIKTTS